MEYLEEYKELLGADYGKLNHQLRSKFIFSLVQRTGRDICYRCGQKIESLDEFSIEHKESYVNKDSETAKKLYFDMNNITFSHLSCNCAASTQGTGKFGYFGIKKVSGVPQGKGLMEYVATCRTKDMKHQRTLTCSATPEEAAIGRDLGTMYYNQGKGKLNFEQFREEYKSIVKPFLDSKREIFYKNGPIKQLVEHFFKKLNP